MKGSDHRVDLWFNETEEQGIEKVYTYNVDGSRKSFLVNIKNETELNLSYEYTSQGQLETVKEDGAAIVSYEYNGEGSLSSKIIR